MLKRVLALGIATVALGSLAFVDAANSVALAGVAEPPSREIGMCQYYDDFDTFKDTCVNPAAYGNQLPPNAIDITVARDGTVSATIQGAVAPTQVGNVQLASFINPAGLQKMGENLFLETAASGAPNQNAPGTNGLGTVMQRYVEASNVNVVEELVNMIQTQRAYEMNSKSIETSDQMLQRLAQI